MYNVTALSNCSDFVCWFKGVNDASKFSTLNIEILSTMIVMSSWILAFVITSRYQSEDSFIASSFLAFFVSLFLALAGLLNPLVVAMMLFVLGVSVVTRG